MAEQDRPMSREELAFAIEMALQRSRALWPKRRVPGIHNPLRPMAEAVADDLERSRVRCVQLAPPDDPGPNVLLRDPGKALPGSAAWSAAAGEDPSPGD